MSIFDLISMATRNLFKRKLRTFLTVFGVVIGTTAIIVMVSLGIAIRENFENEMKNWGNMQIITVNNPAFNYDGMRYDENGNASVADRSIVLDDKMLDDFMKIENVEVVTPIIEDYLIVGAGKYMTDGRIIGIKPDALPYLGLTVSEGRLFGEGESGVAVFGSQISQNFRKATTNYRMSRVMEPPNIDVLNDKLVMTYDWSYGTRDANKQIKGQKMNCVGILAGQGYDTAYSIYVPIDDLKKIVEAKKKYEQSFNRSTQTKKVKGYQTVWVKCIDIKSVKAVQDVIKAKGFDAWSQADSLESLNRMTSILQMFLGAIGAVSLFVAAIGIANTMVMSIYERTKEIGVMKVIGASLADIRGLFLTEAAFIGFLGGSVGIGLSYILSYFLNRFGAQIMSGMFGGGGDSKLSSIPIWLALAALAFATFIGIIFGFFPARRAMKLSVLSAIRTE